VYQGNIGRTRAVQYLTPLLPWSYIYDQGYIFPLTDPLGIYISTLFIFETGFEKPLTSPIQ
jgi:hypothetical protein